jgi:aspartate aminotransferase
MPQFNESQLASRIKPSPTLAVTKLVAEMRKAGKQIIDLGAGEPDFDTPYHVKEGGIAAIRSGKTKYTDNAGVLELREQIARILREEHQAEFTPAQITVSNGAKQAIYNTLLAICNPGDEVILPSPYWVSYPDQISMAGGAAKILPCAERNEFKITPSELRHAITPKTKLLILNSPSNPTGTVYSAGEQEELVEVIRQSGIYVISDEIYIKLVYDGVKTRSLASFPEIREQVILINGFSKAYAMTGWRLGYSAAPLPIAAAINKIQSHLTSNASSISQAAGLEALRGDNHFLDKMLHAFNERRRFLHDSLNGIPGISATMPKGAFYLFANVSKLFGARLNGKAITTAGELCNYLVERCGVALVPGEAFGSNEHVRLSYATSMENLREATSRIKKECSILN